MRTLSKKEVFQALQYAKSLPESEGAKILSHFRDEQPNLCEMLFAGFPAAIAQQDEGMAHLFMDLCFDVICVYSRTLGGLPEFVADREWLMNKMTAMQNEIMALQDETNPENAQTFLLEYIDMAIQEHITEHPTSDDAEIAVANFLFLATRIFDALYSEPARTHH